MNRGRNHAMREILREAQRRVPASHCFIQEAFTSEHRQPVYVKITDWLPDTFYLFDEMTAAAFRDAVIDWAAAHSHGRLTVSCAAFGEFQAQRHRFQHLAGKVERLRVLAVGTPERFAGDGAGLEIFNTNGGVLSKYRIALKEGSAGALFICKETKSRTPADVLCLGFFTSDAETIDEVASDIDLVIRNHAQRLPSFERLQLLHQTTQRVARELESYSRRMELAIQRARRRPDLLTPARFERIVRQSVMKMEQLKEIPRRALRTLGKSRW